MSNTSPAMKMATQIALSNRQCYMDYMAAARRTASEVPGFCGVPLWDVSSDVLEGDYGLDVALALKLSTELLPKQPRGSAQRNMLEAYLLSEPGGEAGSTEYIVSSIIDAAVGPKSILSTTEGMLGVGNAAYASQTTRAIEQAQQRLLAGKMASIRINDYMTLYNANKSGRGRPRLRIRINKMPLRFVAPAFGMENLRELRNANTAEMLRKNVLPRGYSSGGFSAAMRGDMPGRMGELARNVHWSGETRFQFLRKPVFPKITQFTRTNAFFSFAPTAAIDLYSSYDSGAGNINWREFGINSAKNQSGNALAAVAGTAVLVFFGSTAPLVIVALGVGIAVQVVWGSFGMPDKTGAWAEGIIGRK